MLVVQTALKKVLEVREALVWEAQDIPLDSEYSMTLELAIKQLGETAETLGHIFS